MNEYTEERRPNALSYRALCAKIARGGAWPAALMGLPLAGVILLGKNPKTFLEFPPVTHSVEHAGFSRGAFIIAALLASGAGLALVRHLLRSRRNLRRIPPGGRFPWWGWLGFAWVACAWALAWGRFAWAAPIQRFTFTPLWMGFIVIVNALSYRETRRCMMLSRPAYFLLLFPVSAVFWWFFEYLNRFVQNWYYLGVDCISPWRYFLEASIPFSTVLPAVLGTADWLATQFPQPPETQAPAQSNPARSRRLPGAVLAVAAAALMGLGWRPDWLFPLVWISPFVVITCVRQMAGKPTVLQPWTGRTRHRLALAALAALACGFFWEMWNCYSLAKWIYVVPYVGRFHVFEMPILGFAGYLPFGLECAAIGQVAAEWLGEDRAHNPHSLHQTGAALCG